MGLVMKHLPWRNRSYFSRGNARMIQLYRNLSEHGLIRIGGDVSDHTFYIANGIPAARTYKQVTIINWTNLADLGDFIRATGRSVMWGLNLGTGTAAQAAEEAVAVDRALGANLHSFEIGNEVDLMPKYSNNYAAYRRAFAEYKAAIRSRLPQAVFSGPDVAGSLKFVNNFVSEQAADMKLVTHHYYCGDANSKSATMKHMLGGDKSFDTRLSTLNDLSNRNRLNYRINEVNSYINGGKPGVSDAFGSALWCLDFMLNVATHGGTGVNMQTDLNRLGFISYYSPIVHDNAGVCTARPEYYGMLAFAMVGHGKILPVSFAAGNMNVAAYASQDTQGTYFLTVINKEAKRRPANHLFTARRHNGRRSISSDCPGVRLHQRCNVRGRRSRRRWHLVAASAGNPFVNGWRCYL